MQILLVCDQSNQPDADLLASQMQARGISVIQINLDDLAEQSSYSLSITNPAATVLTWQQQVIHLADIALMVSVYNPTPCRESLSEWEDYVAAHERWAHRQGLLDVLQTCLAGKIAFSQLGRAADLSANFPRQYLFAQQAGLPFPASLCSNDAPAIRAFIQRCGGRAVARSLSALYQTIGLGHLTQRGDILSSEQCEFDAALFESPALYQALHEVAVSVKVIVTASLVQAYQVNSTANLQTHALTELSAPLSQIACAPDLVQSCQRFLHFAGLRLATLDFVIDTQQRWWFIGISGRLCLSEVVNTAPATSLLSAMVDDLLLCLSLPNQLKMAGTVLQ